jgi:TolB protein
MVYSDTSDLDPAWSPDGQHLAFASDRGENDDIYLFDLGTHTMRRLMQNTTYDRVPTWSPDGSYIAFQSCSSGDYAIWMVPVAGGEPLRITRPGMQARAPAFRWNRN